MLSSLLLSLGAVCLSFGAAVPTLSPRDISSGLLDDFNLISQYAMAANCKANHNELSDGSPVYCDDGFCPMVKAADTEILHAFWEITPGDSTGYIAVDRTNKLIIVIFRGTVSDENGQTDLQFAQDRVPSVCANCKAHHGFWAATQAADQVLREHIDAAVNQYPDFRLVIAGHSLGGAISTLEATLLRNAGRTVDMYSFGAPCVGNRNLAEYITNQQSGTNYRITHTNDEVPKVLYKASREIILNLLVPEYSQSSPEYWITSGNRVEVTTADVQAIQGVDNESGNLGTGGIDLGPHGWYFGNTSVCAET